MSGSSSNPVDREEHHIEDFAAQLAGASTSIANAKFAAGELNDDNFLDYLMEHLYLFIFIAEDALIALY